MSSQVVYVDLGLDSLGRDAERLLEAVLDKGANDVKARMSQLIIDRGFFDTGATANSVAVDTPRQLEREIGPSTDYAIYGELGWERGNAHFAGLHFARDALYAVKDAFVAAIGAAVQKLGKG